jgi:outer membrane protein TolC
MRIKHLLLGSLVFLSYALQAQEKKPMTLDEAIATAVSKSTEVSLANSKVTTSKYEVDNVKNTAYPDFKISGQYQRLTEPTLKLKIPLESDDSGTGDGGTTASPKVNQVMLGQATLSLPIFAGGKIKNNIKVSENLAQAEVYNAKSTKEQVALQALVLYTNLYKANESVSLIQEYLKSAQQRVKDFTAMEKNGLLARNDLLKSQLQASNVEISLEDAKKNVSVINYQLVTLLKLPENTLIVPTDVADTFKKSLLTPEVNSEEAVSLRNDLEAIRWQQKAAEANVKVAKAAYYPSLSFLSGYTALDIQNVASVYNAVNFGVGLSYDVSDIFKNSKRVKAASSRAEESRQQVELMTDRVKVQVQQAQENYKLSLKQDAVYNEAMEQATENYRIVKDKYDNGLVDTNDLLEADVDQLLSKINQAYSKADITQRYYELLNASGKLTNSLNLTQNN